MLNWFATTNTHIYYDLQSMSKVMQIDIYWVAKSAAGIACKQLLKVIQTLTDR